MNAVRPHWAVGLATICALAFGVLIPGPQAPAAGANRPPANLLVNGSFEQGPEDVGEFLSLDKDSTAIKGWIVIKGQIDLVGTYWQAADGKRSLDLHGSPGYGGVAQTFKTEEGKKYKVTFSLAANPDGSVAKKKMAVRAAGQEKEFTADSTGRSTTDMGWKKHTWEFTAKKAQTTLELYTLMDEDENCGPALDDVSVVPADD
jgi:choice-of-anchor C domain-containing protein